MKTREIVDKLKRVKETASGWQALCPAHEDKNPSLSITEKDGKTLIRCHAGCTTDAVCEAVGITTADLFADKPTSRPQRAKQERYEYRDIDGNLIGIKTRYDKPDGSKSFAWSDRDKSQPLPLYGSECIPSAEDIIILTEGERKRDQLQALGYTALSVPAGAGAGFKPEWRDALKGKDVVLMPDNDKPGQDACTKWANKLRNTCNALRIARVPDQHNDIVDLFNEIGSSEERRTDALIDILMDAKPGAEVFAEQITDNVITGFDTYTLQDLKNYETPKDHFLAGNGILRRKAGCLLAGSTGIGKSVLVNQIAVSCASGSSILGCIAVPKPIQVLYIEAENDADTLKRDALAAVKHLDAPDDIVQQNLVIQHVWGKNGADFDMYLAKACKEFKPDLIIIDPYQAFVDASDLNGSHAFLEWIIPIQRLMHARNMGLLLVAHAPKPAQRDNWNHREQVYLAAGSSVISNWARTSMELMPAQHEVDRFRLTFGKNAERNGLIDDSGRIVREIYIRHSGNIHEPFWAIAENQQAPSKSKYAQQIMELAIKHPSMSYSEIASELGCSKATVAAHYPKDIK